MPLSHPIYGILNSTPVAHNYFALSFLSSTQKCKIPTDNTVTWFQLASCYTWSFYLEFEQYMNITYAGILDNQ